MPDGGVGKIHPSHDAGHEVGTRRRVEELLRLFQAGPGLDQHSAIHSPLREERTKVLGTEPAPDGGQVVRHPGIVGPGRVPEMLVRVDR